MKIISNINLKGGTAKTLTTITMADILATKSNKKVLVIDNDPQGNSSQFFQQYDSNKECGTAQLLRGTDATKVIQHTDVENLDIISGNLDILSVTDEMDASMEENLYMFNNTLQSVADNYDYCIIDNPPSLALNVINALIISDDVIIPVKLGEWSLDGLQSITEQVEEIRQLNTSLSTPKCLITDYKNTKFNEAAEMWLRIQTKYPVFLTKIRHSDKVEQSIAESRSIVEYSRRSAAAVDYIRFVQEYIKQEG